MFTPDELAHGVASLVTALHQKSPESKILLLGILPRGPSFDSPDNAVIAKTNLLISRLANDQKVFYLDVGSALVDPDGSISPSVMPDRLHVAEPGYQRWMAAMAPTLRRVLGN